MRDGNLRESRALAGAASFLILAMALVTASPVLCQDTEPVRPGHSGTKSASAFLDNVLDYLNVANQGKSRAFQPLTQQQRNNIFAKSLINPVWYLKGTASAGMNQWRDIPEPWEHGASGYGKRFADIMGQYAIKKTMTFGLESLLHEDNRYFGSARKSFWPRTGYALSSGILARHDNGKRYPSASLLIGFGSAAYLSRLWQPAGARSIGDAASSFGISMGWNIGLGVVKEFLPDLLRSLVRDKKGYAPTTSGEIQKQ